MTAQLSESEKKFLEFDWTDSRWQDYLRNLEPTPPQSKILKWKKKFYKSKIDSDFDVTTSVGEPAAAPSSSGPTRAPTTDSTAPAGASANEDRPSAGPPPQHFQPGPGFHMPPPPPPSAPRFSGLKGKLSLGLMAMSLSCSVLALLGSRWVRFVVMATMAGLFLDITTQYPLKFSMEYLQHIALLDSFQTLLFGMCLAAAPSLFVVVLSPAVTALIAVCDGVVTLCGPRGEFSNMSLGGYKDKAVEMATSIAVTNRDEWLTQRARSEILLGVYSIFLIFFGKGSLIFCFLFYTSMRIRCMMSVHSQTAFKQLDGAITGLVDKPQCPGIIRKGYHTLRTFLRNQVDMERMAQQQQQQNQARSQGGGGLMSKCAIM
mmetsp:Transcript_55227/g.108032  ORF Transcript_55227/g.108032 Transcript_55227/m.108032 type:complete len:374 (+) Transcript_55227:204-1325(+)